MTFNVRCWTPPPVAHVIAMIFLTGCATAGSDRPVGACPPVVEYSQTEQARVAEELAALPEGAMIPEWIADYAVLREQVRGCARR